MDFSTSAAFLPNLDSLNTRTKEIPSFSLTISSNICWNAGLPLMLLPDLPASQYSPATSVPCKPHIPSVFPSALPGCTPQSEQPWKPLCKDNISSSFSVAHFLFVYLLQELLYRKVFLLSAPQNNFFHQLPENSGRDRNTSLFCMP